MRRLALILMVLVSPLAYAQAYKWKDAQGVTHYADAPPPGNAKYEKIKTNGTAEAPAPAGTAAAPATAAKAAPAGSSSDTPENRAHLCTQLRGNMDILNKEAIVSMDDGKGGTKQLDDASRKRQIEMTQAQMTLYCK